MSIFVGYLHRFALVKKSICAEFWTAIVEPHSSQWSDNVSNVCRGNSTSACLEGIYRQAGVQRSPEMIFMGITGKRTGVSRQEQDKR